MAPPVAIMVCACRNSSTPLTLLCAGNLLEGVKRGIGNLVFVTLPPKVLRVLRAGVPGESYVKGWHLLPWHVPGPPAVLPHPLPRCAHSLSLAALTHMTYLRCALVVPHPAGGPPLLTQNHPYPLSQRLHLNRVIFSLKRSTLFLKDLLHFKAYSLF